jgi:hypothetical protein
MGELTTEITNDLGDKRWLASDGKEYKTRAGAWKHSKKLEEVIPEQETVEAVEDEVVWADADWGQFNTEETPSEVIPTVLKQIKTVAGDTRKLTKKEAAAKREMNESIIKVGYRTSDHVLTKYKRVMMEDEKAEKITHSEADLDWISNITNEALEDQGLSVGDYLGTGTIAVAANSYWFGSIIHRIHKESEKSPFKGKLGGAFGRILEKLPFIGKRIRAKKNPKVEGVLLDD